MDQWLIRTEQNWIAGPYPKAQVCQMILDGKLTLQDEVCPANGFWIYLHEREEVKKQLGIEVPRSLKNSSDEITETQALEDEEVTDTDLSTSDSDSQRDAKRLRDLEALTEASTETTAVFHTNLLKDRSKGSSGASSEILPPSSLPNIEQRVSAFSPKVEIMGQIERPSFWRGFIWILVLLTGVVLFWVVRLIRS